MLYRSAAINVPGDHTLIAIRLSGFRRIPLVRLSIVDFHFIQRDALSLDLRRGDRRRLRHRSHWKGLQRYHPVGRWTQWIVQDPDSMFDCRG